MKRILKLFGSLLGLLALAALVVVLTTTFWNLRGESQPGSSLFQSPIETPTQPPYPPPATPTPSGPPATPPVVPTPVPPCTFAGKSAPAEPGPPLETYQFAEPRVVLTHTSAIGIAGWLPDGQRLLITKEIPGTNRQVIEIFNARTGEEFVYAERLSLTGPPVWLSSPESVVFIDSTVEEGDVLRLSDKSGGPVETLRTNLASPYLAADSAGKKVAILLRDQAARPAVMDLLEKRVQLFDVELPLSSIGTLESTYHATWNPKENQVAFYNDSGLYLFDAASERACQVALGLAGLGERGPRWAYLAKWSPNGRYLAMITTSGRFPLEFSELTILDTVTGDLRTVQPKRHLHSGKYYVLDIDWAPDSTTIAARVAVTMKEGVVYDGLYLMSASGIRQERQLPELTFTGASAGLSLSWSSNEKYLVLNCPTSDEGRLCQIAVTK